MCIQRNPGWGNVGKIYLLAKLCRFSWQSNSLGSSVQHDKMLVVIMVAEDGDFSILGRQKAGDVIGVENQKRKNV